jgi:hypothetical protein
MINFNYFGIESIARKDNPTKADLEVALRAARQLDRLLARFNYQANPYFFGPGLDSAGSQTPPIAQEAEILLKLGRSSEALSTIDRMLTFDTGEKTREYLKDLRKKMQEADSISSPN